MSIDTQKRIIEYGIQVDDLSAAGKYDELHSLLKEMKAFSENDEEAKADAGLFYFMGTGFDVYADHLVRTGKTKTDLDVIEIQRISMAYYRKAITFCDQKKYDDRLDLRIYTNYANLLLSVGRVIEALYYYRTILHSMVSFSMARGNYGRALMYMANIVNDSGHHRELHCYAYQAIRDALSDRDIDMHEGAARAFQDIIDKYESLQAKDIVRQPIVFPKYPLGGTEESAYRKWCLHNHLFLNPLNEVMQEESAFAHDPLTITSFTEDLNNSDAISGNPAEPPRWFAMLNQLKEEYVYARYLCFEGINRDAAIHYADKDVQLSLASYDYCKYSIRIEQIKAAYRILYSMLDKICFFMNDFWRLGLSQDKVNARRICNSSNYPKDNRALSSLYWILSEFYEVYGEDSSAPNNDLVNLRHALEHKFVKVHEGEWSRKLQYESDHFFHISEDALSFYTLRLLRMIREALMYLVYAVEISENNKEKTGKAVPMYLSEYPDSSKL